MTRAAVATIVRTGERRGGYYKPTSSGDAVSLLRFRIGITFILLEQVAVNKS